jgi:hypothetical protein
VEVGSEITCCADRLQAMSKQAIIIQRKTNQNFLISATIIDQETTVNKDGSR